MRNTEIPRELIVMIGMTCAGKTYHVDKFYLASHQIISSRHIKQALKNMGIANDELLYMNMDVVARANMLKGLPIIVDENNLTVESLFIWKKLCNEHKYQIKGVLIDTPLEVCVKRLSSLIEGELSEQDHQRLKEEYDQIEELKILLNMKYQNILGKVNTITYNGG